MTFSKIFGVFMILFALTQFASAILIPPTYKLFSGTIDFTGMNNVDFSTLCGTPGVTCDGSGLITIVTINTAGYSMVSFTDLRFMPGLKHLSLIGNNIAGLFPTEICTLEHLQGLVLS
eukprot:gnl/Chilomastix_caulleri/610.p1 GENE.gnl/Chilomastix_caulleri/610~~gnl/Chilomastix_caulleri/610.p1  ORF type:complete len:118 (+),score=11.22 gnl/Chilomastix_caulleri/610:466-819(+)